MGILHEKTIPGLHEALISRLPPLDPNTNVLDIGCGSGAWLERLSLAGFKNLHGIDQNSSAFNTTTATFIQKNFDVEDLESEQNFGFISAIEVMEHLENPGRLLSNISRLLEPNGVFLCTTPNIHSVVCRLRFLATGKLRSFDAKGDPTHIYPILLEAWERLLPRHRLLIESVWGYPDGGRSLISRPITRFATGIAAKVFPKVVEGDNLCMLIRRAA